jgi:hypothetical protein
MPTNRTPRQPRKRPLEHYSDDVVSLFATMEASECTCQEPDPERYWEHRECAGCRQWWSLHARLASALAPRPPPWEWPVVRMPDDPAHPTGPTEARYLALRRAVAGSAA